MARIKGQTASASVVGAPASTAEPSSAPSGGPSGGPDAAAEQPPSSPAGDPARRNRPPRGEKERIRLAKANAPTSRAQRLRAHLSLFFVDHGFFRALYLNLHRVGRSAWRSAQPAPRHLRRVQRLGVKTIVNLRGAEGLPPQVLEVEACEALGLAYREVKLRSRDAPRRETIDQVAALLEQIEYPALFHCKAGADRAGLMSALYLLLREDADVATAKRQLSLLYGHVRSGPTGAIDAFFDAAEAAETAARAEGRPFDFLGWARAEYDHEAVMAAFRSSGWGALLIDRILKRE